jgi:hypothetical protein
VRVVLATLVLVLLATPGVAAAAEKAYEFEAGRCVKRARDDQRTCVQNATVRCRADYETGLLGCFHSNADCARKCIEEQATCRRGPQTSQDGCRLACGSDLRVELDKCKQKADLHGCESPVRVKALKCKQNCNAETAPKLQECMTDFDDCIGMCVRAAQR